MNKTFHHSRLAVPVISGFLLIGSAFLFLDTWPHHVLATIPWPILAAGLFICASLKVGAVVDRNSTFEESFCLGALTLSLIHMILGSTIGFTAPLLAGTIVVIVILPLRTNVFQKAKQVANDIGDDLLETGAFGIGLFALSVVGILWALLGTLVPQVTIDAMIYHLQVPAQYLARGHIGIFDKVISFYQYTQAQEMMTTFLLALERTGMAASIFLGLVFPITAIAAWRTAGDLARTITYVDPKKTRADFVSLSKILALTCVSTLPLCAIIVSHTKPDTLAMALFFLGLRRLISTDRCLIRSSLYFGGSIAVKMTSLYGVVPAVLYMLWLTRKEIKKWIPILVSVSFFGSFWFLRNLFLLGRLLPHADYVVDATQGGIGPQWGAMFARLFAAVFLFLSKELDGPLGPLFAACCAATAMAIIARNKKLLPVSLIGLGSVLLWLVSGGGSSSLAQGGVVRFLLASFAAPIAVGSVYTASLVVQMAKTSPSGERLLKISLIIATCVSILTSIQILEAHQKFLPYLSGERSVEEFTDHWLDSYRLQVKADSVLPKDAVILSVGDPRLFNLHRSAIYDHDGYLPRVLGMIHNSDHDSQVLRNYLLEYGITHVLDGRDFYTTNIMVGVSPSPDCVRDRPMLLEYLNKNGELIISDDENGSFMYKL